MVDCSLLQRPAPWARSPKGVCNPTRIPHNSPGMAPDTGKCGENSGYVWTGFVKLSCCDPRAAQAEARGLGGTGMGCFLDDAASQEFGAGHGARSCLYHFAARPRAQPKTFFLSRCGDQLCCDATREEE